MRVGIRWSGLRLPAAFSVISLLVPLCTLALASDPIDNYRLDALHADSSGSVSAVLQIPHDPLPDATSFRLLEDGEATASGSEVRPLGESDWQLSLIICLDTSGTMKGNPTDEVKTALKDLLAGADLRDSDEIALRTFDDSTRRIWWFNTEQSRIEKAIDKLSTRGQLTVLYDALYAALNDFASMPTQSRNIRRVLLISDGKNEVAKPGSNAANHSEKEVLKLAQSQNIPIDFLARVREDRVTEDLKEGYVEEVRALSDQTGGYFEYAEPGQVYPKVRAMLARIMAKPVVNFQREINNGAGLTEIAGIAHGEWRQELPNAISRTLPPEPEPHVDPPKPILPSWLLWLLAFAAIVLFALLTFRSRKDNTHIAQPAAINAGEPVSPPPEALQPNRRVTMFSTSDNTDDAGTVTLSLNCIGGPAAGSSYPFKLDRIQIGSDETLGNDLCVTEDEHMSAEHARIEITGGRMLITDLNATNGTLLNGSRLDPGAVTPMHSGDQIQMGMSIFEVHASSMESSVDE